MNEAREYIQFLINENRLEFNGQLIFDGEIIENIEVEAPSDYSIENEFGFYGKPDNYGCRKNALIDAVIRQWSKSNNPFERKAARLAPNKFMFFDTKEELNKNNKLKNLFYTNHNRYFNVARNDNRIHPLIDYDGNLSKGRSFINFGNYNIPSFDDIESRISQVNLMPMFIEFWLQNQKKILMFGSIGDRK